MSWVNSSAAHWSVFCPVCSCLLFQTRVLWLMINVESIFVMKPTSISNSAFLSCRFVVPALFLAAQTWNVSPCVPQIPADTRRDFSLMGLHHLCQGRGWLGPSPSPAPMHFHSLLFPRCLLCPDALRTLTTLCTWCHRYLIFTFKRRQKTSKHLVALLSRHPLFPSWHLTPQRNTFRLSLGTLWTSV